MQNQSSYFTAYHNLKLTRDDQGVLVAEFHSNGGPFMMTAQSHTEFVEAFYRIAQDRANKIPLKERIVREVGYGLSLEGASSAALMKSTQAKSELVARKGKGA
jgi:hypothetical protein